MGKDYPTILDLSKITIVITVETLVSQTYVKQKIPGKRTGFGPVIPESRTYFTCSRKVHQLSGPKSVRSEWTSAIERG